MPIVFAISVIVIVAVNLVVLNAELNNAAVLRVVVNELKAHVDALHEKGAEFHAHAERLKAHAQQLHDETQARHVARVVPTRG